MSEPADEVMDLIFARWRSQTLYAGVQLGVFEAATRSPRRSEELAAELDLDPELTYRLLRALGSLGLLQEGPDRTFSLTEQGVLLQDDHPQSLRGVVLLEEGDEHYTIWRHLPEMVREGEQNAFRREYGRMAFEHAREDPDYGQVFDEAMDSYSRMQTSWTLDALPTEPFESASRVCDVGGGRGHLLAHLLEAYPHLTGEVLELPKVVEESGELAEGVGVIDRITFTAGDMFEAVPEADAYLMKMILHDWSDDECVEILKNIRGAAEAGVPVFAVEHVVPGPETPHFSKVFDVHMMCWGTGRERTVEEYGELFERAGMELAAHHEADDRPMSVVEGRVA